MISEILIASNNPDKISELNALLSFLPIKLHSLSEFPHLPQTVEDCDSIAKNAMKKALEAAVGSGLLALADDTGLFIEALKGEPGVFAARFAGENCSYADNRNKALRLLENESNRKASFKTAVALAAPDGIIAVVEGVVKGEITLAERGDTGFGYDSIFAIEGVTYAEMDADTKNRMSHRAAAIKKMLPILENMLQEW